jgi:hypothetical protein
LPNPTITTPSIGMALLQARRTKPERAPGRWENLWAAQEPCVTRLLDRDAVIDKLIYAAVNPVS